MIIALEFHDAIYNLFKSCTVGRAMLILISAKDNDDNDLFSLTESLNIQVIFISNANHLGI